MDQGDGCHVLLQARAPNQRPFVGKRKVKAHGGEGVPFFLEGCL